MTPFDLKTALAARSSWLWPLAGLAALAFAASGDHGGLSAAASAIALIGTVFAAVHHAEVIASKTGEPFGPLILAIAVTVIEVGLILSIMLGFDTPKPTLARDTVFSAVMIACNGIVGACLLAGGVKHHSQRFRLEGASATLAVLAALTALTLIVPNVTTSAEGPAFSKSQTAFAAVISLFLYFSFVFIQTVRHRDSFMPAGDENDDGHTHFPNPTAGATAFSAALLLVALTCVVLLAKFLTPALEHGIDRLGAPRGLVGVVIATIVLLPEGIAALRAASANRLQTSLNLALGSALASIALTIPAIGALSIVADYPIELGLPIKDVVLLALTLLISVITLGTGRTTLLQGVVHLSIFASFVFFVIVP
ncbi:MAG TPA: ionic transporter y4hA [Rhodoblastus sp.]|nr:ionic transporter y4hA [Rhodoblastus sp.]